MVPIVKSDDGVASDKTNLNKTRAHSIIARRRIMIKKVKTNVIT